MAKYFSSWKFPLFMALIALLTFNIPYMNTFFHELGHVLFGLFTLTFPIDFYIDPVNFYSGYYLGFGFLPFTLASGGAIAGFLALGYLLVRFHGVFGFIVSLPWFYLGLETAAVFSHGDLDHFGAFGLYISVVINLLIVHFIASKYASAKQAKLRASRKVKSSLPTKRVPLL